MKHALRLSFATLLLTSLAALHAAEIPARGVHSLVPGQRWEEAFVSGNGRMGAMLFGNPTNETLIANHCRLFLRLGNREIVPDLAQHVPELRRIIREQNYGEAMAFFLGKAKEQGYPGLIPTDPFHPGFFVRISQSAMGEISGYEREENFQTGELTVRWRDARGVFQRRVFVSRTENLLIASLTGPADGKLDCELFFPPVSPNAHAENDGGWTANLGSNLIESQQQTSAEWVTYHNTYLKGKGGYYRFIEDFYPEWRLNAKRTYCCRGFLTNARASNTALMLRWGDWPGVFWTAGAGWLAHFFHDGWQYGGDREFLAHRVVPLLKEAVAFYEDFAVLNPNTGLYEFLPSYSPESSTGITPTMDVIVCKETLTSLIESCRVLGIERDNIARWEAMRAKLPPYRINKDDALAEWIPEGGSEHYKHRHLSHLHALYEATDDLTPEQTPELWRAAHEAVRLRIHSNGEHSSHGRMHMGLAAAHLRLAEEAYGRLAIMATIRSMYPSLMCAHEPGPRIFNLDANGAMPEIVNRLLIASRPGQLDLLPALSAVWP